MILEKFVKIKITKYTHWRYKEYGEVGDIIDYPIDKLSHDSHHKVLVKCENCGKEKYMQIQRYYEHIKRTGYFYCDSKECINKSREIQVQKKYKVKNVFQLESVKKQIIKTNIANLGCENPQQNKDIKEKTEQTNIIVYGFRNVFQNEDIKEKSKETRRRKYNCDYNSQNLEIFNKMLKSGYLIKYYRDIMYQGTYELDFLKHCETLNIFDKIQRGKTVRIGKICYHPDFYIEELNLIVEIKSSYWLKVHDKLNKKKIRGCKKQGFNIILIVDKDYKKFDKIISKGF